ncbi:MAG: outer membrane protein assembly factor BamA [Paracoccaceae bacterium]
MGIIFGKSANVVVGLVQLVRRAFFSGIIMLILGFGAGPAVAQSYQFSSFSVQGNSNIQTPTILSHAGLSAGQAVSASELNQAYQRVLATGLFESVDFTPQGRRLLIQVVEFRSINRVNFEGNSRIDDERALSLIQSRPRLVFNPSTAEQDAAALTEAYRAQGRLSATVTPIIIERSNNRVDLVFEVHEGRTVEVERLSFVGNRTYSDRRLRRVLETKQAGSLRALIRQDNFVEDRLEFDKALLRDFYQSRGYVDFQTLSVTSEFSRERNAFFVTFNIREGQKYQFGTITVTSDLPEVDIADYQSSMRIRTGQTYNPSDVDTTIARMEKLALRQGLNLVRVDPRVTRNDRDLTLDIEFALVRGPRIFVERIDIEGNATTLDRVIRQQFRVVEGDPFNPREIREAAARIQALALFSRSSVNARQGTSSDQVIVDVDLEERKTGSLSFGAAYNFSKGVGLTAKFSERNFLGRGQALRFDFSLGLDNSEGGVTFIEPAFLGRDLVFRFDGEYRKTEFDYTNYDTQKINFRPSFDFPISDRTRIGVRYTYADDRIFNVDAGSSPVLMAEEAAGATRTSALGYTFSYDTRRSGLDSKTGFLVEFGQDFAGLGGSVKYIKSTAKLSAETKILNEELTIRATLEGGSLNSLGGVSGLTDRFFLNNTRMRGFAPAGVGPRDLTVANTDALGGNYFAVARFETEFPLGLPEELGINGGLFVDFGSVWGLDNTNGGAVDDSMHIRSSAGLSVFWKTPVGPLRFNFSRVLQQQTYDSPQNFDLTISTEF